MSIESIAACLHHSKASGTDKVVLLGIANHDGDGGAYPSIATLAKYARVSERAVQNSVNKLISMGEVRRFINAGGSANTPRDQRPNRYEILVRCPADCDGSTKHKLRGEVSYQETERGEVGYADGVKSATERGEAQFTLTIQEPSLEPSIFTRTFQGEVIAACNLLADLIEANGSTRPAITNKWLIDMERINRLDGRTWEQITKAIEWCQNDEFWRANIMSPGKLRKQYDQLRLKAQSQQKSSNLSGWARVIAKLENQQKELES